MMVHQKDAYVSPDTTPNRHAYEAYRPCDVINALYMVCSKQGSLQTLFSIDQYTTASCWAMLRASKPEDVDMYDDVWAHAVVNACQRLEKILPGTCRRMYDHMLHQEMS